MKKLLLITAASAAILSSTAFAAEENTFYLKANAGINKMNQVKFEEHKLKSKIAPIVGFGVGYYIMDNVRTDLALDFLINPQAKKTFYGVTGKSKANITTLMLSGYVDMFDVSVAKIFAGAGVGISKVKEKRTASGTDTRGGEVVSYSESSKNKTNVAYHVTLGAAAEVAPGVNAELSYSWKDFGKSKFKGPNTTKGASFKGHHVLAGVRFDL